MVYGPNTPCKENKSQSLTRKVYNWRCQTTERKQGQFKELRHSFAQQFSPWSQHIDSLIPARRASEK